MPRKMLTHSQKMQVIKMKEEGKRNYAIGKLISESYRITPEVLERLRTTLKLYKGTHNYHNFTARKKAHEASANRYIMDINTEEPFVREGLEWVVIKIKGQSFMLHQIRKMVGLAMAISQGLTDASTISRAWGREKLDIPIAPGLGLVLEEPHYHKYNKRYGNDGFHETLEWDNETEKIQEFREQHIDSCIVKTEIRERPMLQWLSTLPLHHFGVSGPAPDTDDQSDPSRSGQPSRERRRQEGYKGSEDEAEDEDEGDLDQYRVVPLTTMTHQTNGHTEDSASATPRGTAGEEDLGR